jgi:hypothetical protein
MSSRNARSRLGRLPLHDGRPRDPPTWHRSRASSSGTVPGGAGDVPGPRLPAGDPGTHPTIVFLHGGGFVIGDLDTTTTTRGCSAATSTPSSQRRLPAGAGDALPAASRLPGAALWAWRTRTSSAVTPRAWPWPGDSAGGEPLGCGHPRRRARRACRLAAQCCSTRASTFSEADEYPSRVLRDREGYSSPRPTWRGSGTHYMQDRVARATSTHPYCARPTGGMPPGGRGHRGKYDTLPTRVRADAAGARERRDVAGDAPRFRRPHHGFFGGGVTSPRPAPRPTACCADLKGLLT